MKQEQLLRFKFQKNNQQGLIEASCYGGSLATVGSKLVAVGKWTYSAYSAGGLTFPAQGGAVGSFTMVDNDGNPCVIPQGAIVTKVYIDPTISNPTSSGSATIAFQIQSAGDLKAATAYTSFTALLDGIPANTEATAIKLTADQTLTMVVGTAALTGGTINVVVEYEMSL